MELILLTLMDGKQAREYHNLAVKRLSTLVKVNRNLEEIRCDVEELKRNIKRMSSTVKGKVIDITV